MSVSGFSVIESAPPSSLPELVGLVPELQALSSEQAIAVASQSHFLLHVAKGENDEVLGFKAGYDRYRDGSWYSWLGGVVPKVRGRDVAQSLLQAQELWVVSQGFNRIVVKTRNKFVGMRILLARNQYQIVGVETVEGELADENRLLHVKWLN